MTTKTEQGYLVLADISGYTSFLASTELDHAHEILTELLQLIVDTLTPVLTLSKLEGDAVFAYSPASRLPRGETVLELIEASYVAFRSRLDSMHRRTTCTCEACRAIPKLDLKFIAHYGEYILQNPIAGLRELVGSDVNLAHRLMKNHITEATGWRAYALFTGQTLQHMNIQPGTMHADTESYEHLGDVTTYSQDLHQRYDDLVAARHHLLTPETSDIVLTMEVNAPPAVVWERLNDPQKRSEWDHGATWSAGERPGGRTGPGSRNHCAHGSSTTIEDVLDWKPFNYCTSELTRSDGKAVVMTWQLEPFGTNTRLHLLIQSKTKGPRLVRRMIINFIMFNVLHYDKSVATMVKLAAADAAQVPQQTE
jgi:uncharacterized protein YndB with AHSA1/START domain